MEGGGNMRPESCKNCGAIEITELADRYECPYCGTRYPRVQPQPTTVIREVHYVSTPQPNPQPVRNNSHVTNYNGRKRCNKWVALVICYFLGLFGGHKFYEGKSGQGLLYLFTAGLFGIGWLIDLVSILFKPNPYYV